MRIRTGPCGDCGRVRLARKLFNGATMVALIVGAFVPGTVHAQRAHAGHISPTDLWVKVDPPDGKYIRVHLNVHSVSTVSCTAREINPVTEKPTFTLYFGPTLAFADKDGTLVLDGVYPAVAHSVRHWVKVWCNYPVDSGAEPQAIYRTSYMVPAPPQPVVPPPDLRAWVDPAKPSYKSAMTLYAKTDPGALCSAYFDEQTAWYPGDPVRARKDGLVRWHWTYQEEGTGYVTCDAHKMYAKAQVDY